MIVHVHVHDFVHAVLVKSRRVTQVRAGHCTALDLRTLGCEMVGGARLNDVTGFHCKGLCKSMQCRVLNEVE